jgi:hypothetical protein
VAISTNFDNEAVEDFVYSMYRYQDLTPPDLNNLNYFLERFEQTGVYAIAPAPLIDEHTIPEPLWELAIEKRKLIVRAAWEVGPGDIDSAVIRGDDNPLIPPGIKDAPVLDVLQQIQGSADEPEVRQKHKKRRIRGRGKRKKAS